MSKYLAILVTMLAALLFTACGDDDDTKVKPMRFYIESSAGGGAGDIGKTMSLPQSGLSYNVRGTPIFTEVDVTNVQLVQVASGDYALLFHLNEPAARKLYRQSVSNNGRVIIFEYGGQALGARQLDGAISDGRYFTFVEMPYPELEKLVMEMQGDTKKMNEAVREARF
ncbi:hypothetical protein [Cerasicoccus frondis]|uniref:hypothetical protein n=1 Tax=Cerasicoccus frondis TaxID=490090 RepID=UPI002852C5CF|nr:hypothetical protein [Cerasicoccus frondis]